MAGSVNRVFLLGTLGKDPEVRFTSGGKAVAKLLVATEQSWKENGEQQSRTEWHNVVVWGKQAEHCGQFLQKGRQACVEGEIRTRQYEDSGGNRKYITEINAQRVTFVGQGPKVDREPGDDGVEF